MSSPRCSRHRLTFVQWDVLDVLREHPEISYDGLADLVAIDRNTAIQAVRRLVRQWRVVKLEGHGRQPNRYLITDRVLVPAPDYVPNPVVLSEQQRESLYAAWSARLDRAVGQEM